MAMMMQNAEAQLRPGRMLIGGEWIAEGRGGEYRHVNPSTGREHPPIPFAGPDDVDEAVNAARAAQPGWWAMPAGARRDTLLRLADLIRRDTEQLAALTSLDNGSVWRTNMMAPQSAADHFTYYAGWIDKIGGDLIPTWPAPALDYALMEPYGVVGQIIPWNVPMYNVGQVVAAGLAAGNAIVFKAPELAPFTVLQFGELVEEAGIPAGVVNILPGAAETGAAMVAHPGIDKIHFIGGAGAAKQIMASAADTLKPVTFELGGKSANIIFADANLEKAIPHAVFFGLAAAGQGCLLPTRVLVEDSIYEQVVEAMRGMASSIAVGDPFAEQTYMGPVISAQACERIMGVIERARADGFRLLSGGERLGGDLANGFFIAPTIFADVDNASDLAQNEVFGPVLAVIRFSTEEEAVKLANDTRYGLAAYVHTSNLSRAHRVAAGLEAGNVYFNGGGGIQPGMPFGGMKQSGFGRMGGRAGLEDFMRPKNVYIPLG